MSALASPRNFLEFEPLLWRVLSKLVRDGYHIQPHDARDLIHDFFLEWEPLNSRFDAAKGEFAPYLATAFYRFGRRRQLKLHRLRSRAVDIEECLDLAAADPLPLEAAELKQQTAQLKEAISHLPEAEQALLADFLSDYAPGERELAEKHRLTRYRMREQLAATVSRVALQLMEARPQEADADIAYRVWVMDQSPRFVAAELGMSTEQVNQAKARFAQALLNSIRGIERPVRQGRNIMPELDILRKALSAFDDSDALEHLRAHAQDIRLALEQEDLLLDNAECAALAAHPEWLASVYTALSSNDLAGIESEELQPSMTAMLDGEQQVIADAWAALLEKLDEVRPPSGPGQWELALMAAEKPEPDLVQHLRQYHASCRRGDPASERLLKYGLSPGMVFEALREMELLFNRSLRRAGEGAIARKDSDADLVVKQKGKSVAIKPKLLCGTIAGTLDLELELAPALARSLVCMMQASPLLVSGYYYLGANTFFKLPETTRPTGFLTRDALVKRWCANQRDIAHGSPLLQGELAR
ncbi:sigma-70 family RNA polymerase sigma factor [Pseudoduganella sp. R-31]|uniref:sigma-70 family RNA polymerase sigma factor n=1 Tax=Pseudoduganella sp. R-31 TaxID=3404060 RepID=UPI003CF927DB